MTNTSHYGLNIAEGTDNYNHLTVDNPNYQKIDTQMWTNAQTGVPTVTMQLQESTIAIARPSGYANATTFKFVSTVNYNQSYTWTVDGTSVTPTLPNGGALPQNAFIIGGVVLCTLNGTSLTVFSVPTVDINSIKIQVLQAVYPVGSIIINESPTNPSTVFGFGTWERIQGRFIFGADATRSLNSTGGAETVTLSEANLAPHSHTITPVVESTNNTVVGGGTVASLYGIRAVTATSTAGSGSPFSIMPPYIAKYIWRRTA